MSLYALPLIGRAGLGNELFPWARAELFARRFHAKILSPNWPALRLGPYLRGEPDKRRYSNCFKASHHVSGVSRFIIGKLGSRISESQADVRWDLAAQSHWPRVVQFKGIAELFAPLADEYELIRSQLWNMTAESMRPAKDEYSSPFIALHVRRGDITRQGFSRDELSRVNQYTPLSWFAGMVRAVRREKSLRSTPILVFTDGDTGEVSELCPFEGVSVHRRRQAITDLWLLARAQLLFASGYSTFGMWASFLGGMPTIYAPGKIQQLVQTARKEALEIELAEDELIPRQVLERVSLARTVKDNI